MTATAQGTMHIRRSDERGLTDLGWLHSRHSFSFGGYQDPRFHSFRSLRVLNDDVVEPGGGFGEHGHHDMEILTWVLSGALEHGDSMGHREVLKPGELQAMSAGSGIRHSEMNASSDEPVHFLQIWIDPKRRGLAPSYDQKSFAQEDRRNQWQRLASGSQFEEGVLHIHQDAELNAADLDADVTLSRTIEVDRYGYLHVASGRIEINGEELGPGDAVNVAGPFTAELRALEPSQVLAFDLS